MSITDAHNNNYFIFEYGYDLNNNVTKLSGLFPLFSFTNNFTYGKDNLLTKYEIESGKNVTYTYDGLNRLIKTSLSTATPIDTTYSYYDSERGDGYTTTKLKSETIDGVTYTYEYDTLGNITDIYRGDTHLYYYEYDAMNQLIYVRDYENAKIYTYTYDTAGNLIAENISDVNSNGSAYNTVHKSYQYTDTNWGDKLTSYDGQTITYDAIGNPLTYRDGMTMTWKNGRQLATLQDSDDTISYEYDSSSIRTSKTVDGVKHTYAYLGGKLMYETRGDAKFYYSYDANGILYSVKYTLTDSSDMLTYFFTHNSRGDIIGIYSDTGVLSAKYEYDAWGNILSITDANGTPITSDTHIAKLNPFRYRGYYYDSETGLYYLMSRYYDPVTHRFINADGYFQAGGSILDTNMSAYCGNNPIMRADYTGHSWEYSISFGLSEAMSAASEVYTKMTSPPNEDLVDAPDLDIDTADKDSYNCYGNGIGKQIYENPTGYRTGDSTRETFDAVCSDLGYANVRELDYINQPIKPDEFKVAMKCGPRDFHFIRLDENGWYNKSGEKAGLYIEEHYVTSSTWYPMYYVNGQLKFDYETPYNYETIYFAVKIGWDNI